MELNRRSFMASLFAGVFVTTIGIGASARASVEIYYEHEQYTAREGVWNIWYFHDDFWYLLSDSNRKPMEFDSDVEAEEFRQAVGYVKADRAAKNGEVAISKAPIQIHPMHFMRQSQEQINHFLTLWPIQDPIARQVAIDLLGAHNGFEQSKIWVKALENHKNNVMPLQKNTGFCEMIRTVYCQGSYHSCLGKLYAFRTSWREV